MTATKDTILWTIGTTGFSASDEITLSAFCTSPGTDGQEMYIYLNTSNGIEDGVSTTIHEKVKKVVDNNRVFLSLCSSESDLLSQMKEFIETQITPRKSRLVTYSGENWQGELTSTLDPAVSVLRTRCVMNEGFPWLLSNISYINIAHLIPDLFLTLTANPREMSYDELCDFAHFIGLDDDSIGTEHATVLREVNEHGFTKQDLIRWQNALNTDTSSQVPLRDLVGHDGLYVEWEDDFSPFDSPGEAVNAYLEQNYLDLVLYAMADLIRLKEVNEMVDMYVSGRYIDEIRL